MTTPEQRRRYKDAHPEVRERDRLAAQTFRSANRELCNARAREWRLVNPEKARTARVAYLKKHRERLRVKRLAYYAANKERDKARHARFAAAHPGHQAAVSRLHVYGLTDAAFMELLASQGNRCGICKTSLAGRGRQTCVDHDHATGQVRGILCNKCNTGMGGLNDDITLLRAAVVYLSQPLLFTFGKTVTVVRDHSRRARIEERKEVIL